MATPNIQTLLLSVLAARGVASRAMLDAAMRRSRGEGIPLWEALIREGADPSSVLAAAAEALGVRYVPFTAMRPSPDALGRVPERLAEQHRVIPLGVQRGVMEVAMVDPLDAVALDDLRRVTGLRIQPVLTGPEDWEAALNAFYRLQQAGAGSHEAAEGEAVVEELEIARSDSPTLRTLKAWLIQALNLGASDAHIEPQPSEYVLRLRIDGKLRDVATAPKSLNLIAAIKVACGMRLDSSLPQDGSMRRRYRGREVDFRVATLPTVHGEKAAIRIVAPDPALLDIYRLGFSEANLRRVMDLLARPSGLILVTGPTGSGKTTTLFAMLKRLNTPERNVITLEDPVEITLPRVNQVSVNPQRGMTYEVGLRALVRQDPDVVLIGELREPVEARLAAQLAMAGSLVLTTLHTSDAPTAPIRLVQMGVPVHVVASVVQGVIAQRLVRRICVQCREEHKPQDEDLYALRQMGIEDVPPVLYRGRGCPHCFGTGYRGRMGIHEVLVMDREVRKALYGDPDSETLRLAAERKGMIGMVRDGYEKCLRGETTVQEVVAEVHRD